MNNDTLNMIDSFDIWNIYPDNEYEIKNYIENDIDEIRKMSDTPIILLTILPIFTMLCCSFIQEYI